MDEERQRFLDEERERFLADLDYAMRELLRHTRRNLYTVEAILLKYDFTTNRMNRGHHFLSYDFFRGVRMMANGRSFLLFSLFSPSFSLFLSCYSPIFFLFHQSSKVQEHMIENYRSSTRAATWFQCNTHDCSIVIERSPINYYRMCNEEQRECGHRVKVTLLMEATLLLKATPHPPIDESHYSSKANEFAPSRPIDESM